MRYTLRAQTRRQTTMNVSRAQSLATRMASIRPFLAMELFKQAQAMERAGRSIVHLNIGEPDFSAPAPVVAALARAMSEGRAPYTAAMGLLELREAIAGYYQQRYRVRIAPEQIIITAGASGALLLTAAALVDIGAEVLLPDPSYPCNRNFVNAFDGIARLVPAGPSERFQLTAELINANWRTQTRGVLVASPSNPTGTSVPRAQLEALVAVVRERGGYSIVDEIYQGLSYESDATTCLDLMDERADMVVVNSFSKYFSMTGWRLGWLVAPRSLIAPLETLSQNLFICPSTLAQRAALACFSEESLAICEARRLELKRRRDYLVPALRSIGFKVPVVPDGAFYVYADCSELASNSGEFAQRLLDEVGVAVVPGHDFGAHEAQRWIRFTYAASMDKLEEAIARMGAALG